MDFSWFGITVIDLGIVSIGIIGFAWLFRRIAILERENGRLQAEVDTLTKENRDLRQELNILAARYTEIKEMLTLLLKRENFIE
ncbi:hypothetical protein F4054_05815 [Candidatus Poribacteria bacterium]|nr:hypothetical protein [Candidatus Poribacteria bacterium]MYK21762.1 hypothetical protein [Candidatus Poribacteria bacterium]